MAYNNVMCGCLCVACVCVCECVHARARVLLRNIDAEYFQVSEVVWSFYGSTL